MRFYERFAFAVGATFVGIAAVYRYVLTPEQRAALQEGTDVVRKAIREVTDTVSPLVKDGPTKSEEEAASAENRARTARQWADLGY